MNATAERLRADLLSLPETDRAGLASVLLESLHGSDETPDAAWDEELARREEEIRNGRVTGISETDFFAHLDARLSVGR